MRGVRRQLCRGLFIARVQWTHPDARFWVIQWAMTAATFAVIGLGIWMPWGAGVLSGTYTLMYWTCMEIRLRRDRR